MRLHLALISSALIFSSVAAAQASDVSTLKKKLAPWQPSEISQKGDQITIALPDANITPEVYSLIISNSCTPIWTKDAPSNYLKNINQINVTNKFKAFGYSFENPLSVCKEMGDLMEKPAEVKMLSNTHIYKAK